MNPLALKLLFGAVIGIIYIGFIWFGNNED